MKLLIVESPNKCQKIKAILGDGWDVAASVGHVRDLPPGELGISMTDFQPQYQFTERGGDVIQKLRQRVSRAQEVYLATDPDREGEAIAWHLKESLNLANYKRVTFDAITPDVVTAAIRKPRGLDMNLVRAQEARRAVDRLVGYQVSPLVCAHADRRGLSAGRVQSVALRLVVERQKAIDGFTVTNHFGAEATFTGDNGKWKAQWNTKPYLPEGEQYILDPALAQSAATCKRFSVTSVDLATELVAPPPAFTTSTLLQAASARLNWKPAETAQVAQDLFAQGLITYHRTDSVNLSAEAIAFLRQFAQAQQLPIPAEPRKWKSKEAAQEAHEAIRPTHIEHREAGENEAQRRLYDLIWKRALASQLADAKYLVTRLALTSVSDGKAFDFRAVGRVLTEPGWKALTAEDAAEETTEDKDSADPDSNAVPALPKGTALSATASRVLEKQTRPPAAYTQASLIKKLEAEGIGRPSTYPAILKNILDREYIEDAKKKLRATPLGIFLNSILVGRYTFIEYDYTRRLEASLDEIASGRRSYVAVVAGLSATLRKELASMEGIPKATVPPELASAIAEGPKCPKCKSGVMRAIKGKPILGCSRYKDPANPCGFVLYRQKSGKTLTENQIETLCVKGQTAVIKGFMSGNAGRKFDAALRLNTDKWTVEFVFDQSKSTEPKNRANAQSFDNRRRGRHTGSAETVTGNRSGVGRA